VNSVDNSEGEKCIQEVSEKRLRQNRAEMAPTSEEACFGALTCPPFATHLVGALMRIYTLAHLRTCFNGATAFHLLPHKLGRVLDGHGRLLHIGSRPGICVIKGSSRIASPFDPLSLVVRHERIRITFAGYADFGADSRLS
jgi:hypothetical protein